MVFIVDVFAPSVLLAIKEIKERHAPNSLPTLNSASFSLEDDTYNQRANGLPVGSLLVAANLALSNLKVRSRCVQVSICGRTVEIS